jgi:hypothetical protein
MAEASNERLLTDYRYVKSLLLDTPKSRRNVKVVLAAAAISQPAVGPTTSSQDAELKCEGGPRPGSCPGLERELHIQRWFVRKQAYPSRETFCVPFLTSLE